MRFSRWLVPAAVAGVVAGGVVVTSAAADGPPAVPDRTPAQVLALAAGSDVTALSGTVRTTADLGLPSLPSGLGSEPGPRSGGAQGPDLQGLAMRLLTGESTLRVWLDGPERQRVQVLDRFSEVSLVHDGRDVWAFDSGTLSGSHTVLPAEADVRAALEKRAAERRAAGLPVPAPGDAPSADAVPTPDTVARGVIDALDPTTQVSLGPAETVAGRAAYSLRLTPRTSATLVDRVVLSVDAATGVPLRAQVFARGLTTPAFESGYTDVDLARPDAARFRFTPPAGADVTTRTLTAADLTPPAGAKPLPDMGSAGVKPVVHGTGWTTVVEVAPPTGTTGGAATADPLVTQLTRPVDGGRAVSTRLFSVLLTDDGRALAGAVPVQALVDAARS